LPVAPKQIEGDKSSFPMKTAASFLLLLSLFGCSVNLSQTFVRRDIPANTKLRLIDLSCSTSLDSIWFCRKYFVGHKTRHAISRGDIITISEIPISGKLEVTVGTAATDGRFARRYIIQARELAH
jgi:hypothetical protein